MIDNGNWYSQIVHITDPSTQRVPPNLREQTDSLPTPPRDHMSTPCSAHRMIPITRYLEIWSRIQFSSVQFSPSVMSHSLRPHESQHARPPCPSPTPGVHSDSCPSSQWCHPAISSSVIPFSSCPQSLPASESFPMSQLFTWGGQSTGVSALASRLKGYKTLLSWCFNFSLTARLLICSF